VKRPSQKEEGRREEKPEETKKLMRSVEWSPGIEFLDLF
jgi:hypothetical protein